jgi:hypothetical protein
MPAAPAWSAYRSIFVDLREEAALIPDAGFLRNRRAALDRDFVASW